MVKNMCKEVGILGNKTNHSLRAYSATALFHAGVPEKLIQDRTGHRSLKGLHKYEKISERQKEDACRALSGRSPMQCQTNSVTNWSMQVAAPMYSSQQQQLTPNCSFGNATLNGCTINVFQAPQTVHNISEDEVGELYSDDW